MRRNDRWPLWLDTGAWRTKIAYRRVSCCCGQGKGSRFKLYLHTRLASHPPVVRARERTC